MTGNGNDLYVCKIDSLKLEIEISLANVVQRKEEENLREYFKWKVFFYELFTLLLEAEMS